MGDLMRPVSERFLRTVRGSHRARVRARVLTSFQTGTEPSGTLLNVIDGSVTLDSTADIRSTLDLTVTGTWGTSGSDLLTPYGNEIFIERGIDYGGGDTEWVSLGYFRINSVEQDGEDGTFRITGVDRMAQVIDNRIVYPAQFPAATTHEALFEDLISTSDEAPFPTATIEFDYDASVATLGAAAVAQESRFDFLYDVVEADGRVMFWDHRGFLVVRAPSVSGDPVFDINTGTGGVLISLSRQLTREGVYNGVLARGSAPDDSTEPPSALVTNDDPTDPLEWGGLFGSVVRYFESQFITTTLQAQTAAQSLLDRYTGLPYDVQLTAVPNPALEPLDVISLTLSDGSTETHVIDALTIPLTVEEPIQLRTRTKNAGDEEA